MRALPEKAERPNELVDFLFVGSMVKYKDASVELFRRTGTRVGNTSTGFVDLYPTDEPLTKPEGCYHAGRGFDSKTYFYGQPIDPSHHLLLFFRTIKYGREFSGICAQLLCEPFNRFRGSIPRNIAIITNLQNRFDEVFDIPDREWVRSPIVYQDGCFVLPEIREYKSSEELLLPSHQIAKDEAV